jgi:hypothetical protein
MITLNFDSHPMTGGAPSALSPAPSPKDAALPRDGGQGRTLISRSYICVWIEASLTAKRGHFFRSNLFLKRDWGRLFVYSKNLVSSLGAIYMTLGGGKSSHITSSLLVFGPF